MKSRSVVLSLAAAVAVIASVGATRATPNEESGLEASCACNPYPSNWPVVGLFHTSQWGTSALKLFEVRVPGDEASLKDSVAQCDLLWTKLSQSGICPRRQQ
ncbi:MAG: hypothetical protein HYZ75_16890 [Elusimicrobia bacterium]|nr:hypothetical protein [Elusimicrobiota bacterium]